MVFMQAKNGKSESSLFFENKRFLFKCKFDRCEKFWKNKHLFESFLPHE